MGNYEFGYVLFVGRVENKELFVILWSYVVIFMFVCERIKVGRVEFYLNFFS